MFFIISKNKYLNTLGKQSFFGSKAKGFSLVEILVTMGIVAIVFVGFYATFTLGSKYIIDAKNRLGAIALANEKMEIVRNLAYDDVGLQGGVAPIGNILQNEDIVANGRPFHVYTQIEYADDDFDGLAEENTDSIPNDYKTVRIVVSWQDGNNQTQEVISVSRFVPPGLETNIGGAPLAINVSNSEGSGVPQTLIHIVNNSVSPAINTTIQTDSIGNIIFPSAPASLGEYRLTITKSGYETISTTATTPTFIPIYPHASVVMGSLNTYGYIQDELSTLIVRSADYQNNPVGNISFTIKGGKVIGHDNLENSIFSMESETGTTDGTNGEKEYADIIPGNYAITMATNTQYEFIDFDPSQSPAVLIPGNDMTYTLRVADKSVNSLFLKVSDSEGNPIDNADVTMTDSLSNEIFSGETTSLRGVLFYPDDTSVLAAGEYSLDIEATGFQSKSESVTISGLTEKDVQLIDN